ncbi:hypothetical protein MMC30_002890 [Trapelia coarctata]|nr:hypothetical protein [Trapelia coarctata]
MVPKKLLPYPPGHTSAESYVEKLLEFITSSDMLQTLCGGVHILDFLVREPDLYETVLPPEWRDWLCPREIPDVLDLLMREDIDVLLKQSSGDYSSCILPESQNCQRNGSTQWRGGPPPPPSLLRYIENVRNLALDRSYCIDTRSSETEKFPVLSRQIAVGMKPKKAHEVVNFAAFIDDLASDLASTKIHNISHLVDFGSGQNYLGRVLISPLYGKSVIAVESKKLNIDGARDMDVSAKLAEKKIIRWNKKEHRMRGQPGSVEDRSEDRAPGQSPSAPRNPRLDAQQLDREVTKVAPGPLPTDPAIGDIQYVEHMIVDGDLTVVTSELDGRRKGDTVDNNADAATDVVLQSGHQVSLSDSIPADPRLMVISLHSCGNLTHHGLRSLVLNESVKAVAMVGCCYNLVTERLGPPTHKLPPLRARNPRLDETGSACDPQGFPMSERMATYKHRSEEGVRLNITARMMAVQAPLNWTAMDCEDFFTRHFFRALLQRIFLDLGIVQQPVTPDHVVRGGSSRGWSGGGEPIIIGSLRKACYASFPAYVRGATKKLEDETERGMLIKERMSGLKDDEILEYEQTYRHKRHELSLIWSLMAFSATLVESVIVVDRWLYLKEQKEVQDCWVQTVFDYAQSPRNLVVVGIKR